MSRIVYGRGNSRIELSGDIKKMVTNVLRRSGGVVVDRMRLEAQTLHDEVHRNWYTKIEKRTGRSQQGLNYGIAISDPKTVSSFVENSAPYVWFIKFPWPDNHLFIYRELIIKPGKKRTRALAKDLGVELRKLARG